MIEKENCFYLGKIIKTHGVKGEVVAKLDCDNANDYSELDSVFIEFRNKLVPFFISNIKVRNIETAIIYFEDIETESKASEMLLNRDLFLPLDCLPELDGSEFYIHEVEGFTIIDKTFGEVGIIEEVIEYKSNSVFRIMKDSKEILIPVADELVVETRRDEKTIMVDLPDGLLDIYL